MRIYLHHQCENENFVPYIEKNITNQIKRPLEGMKYFDWQRATRNNLFSITREERINEFYTIIELTNRRCL
jgi:hypothetical protein